jgi:hypothetical protein
VSERPDLDAPQPPGGLQRQDAPSTGHTPGEPAPDPGPGGASARSSDSDVPEPTTDPERQQGGGQRDLQEENAETSLDQPSS